MKSIQNQNVGGQGVDGMVYVRSAVCPNSPSQFSDAVRLSADMKTAQYIRQNCVNLTTPQSVAVSSLGFAVNEQSVFVLNQGIFTTVNDGSSLAPVGQPQLPFLFSSYVVRPSWKVAGVDYAVGPKTGANLKDPITIAISGVTVDPVAHQVTVQADNITLDGYDFSLAGGWSVVVGENSPVKGTKILNSNFAIGVNRAPMIYGVQATNLYVGYCSFDSNSKLDGLGDTSIFFTGSGLTVEYSLFKNSPKGFIQSGPGIVVVRYNVFMNAGQAKNTGASWIMTDQADYVAADYNTFYQTQVTTGSGTDGISVTGWSSSPSVAWTIKSAEILANSMVTLAGAKVNSDIFVSADHLVGTALVRDNYIDPTGTLEFAEPGSSCALGACAISSTASSIFSNNLNLVNGSLFPTNP